MIFLFLKSSNVKKFEFLIGICPGYVKKMQTSAFLKPLPCRVGKHLQLVQYSKQLGTPAPPKNFGRPLWWHQHFFFHAPKTKMRSERAPIPIAKTNGGIIEKYESLGNSRGSIVKDTMMNRVQSASFLTRKIEPMMMMAAFRDILLKFSSCVL